jgi:hypothetical protein
MTDCKRSLPARDAVHYEYCKSVVFCMMMFNWFLIKLELIVRSCGREESIDYGALMTALRKTCLKLNLKDVDGKL